MKIKTSKKNYKNVNQQKTIKTNKTKISTKKNTQKKKL